MRARTSASASTVPTSAPLRGRRVAGVPPGRIRVLGHPVPDGRPVPDDRDWLGGGSGQPVADGRALNDCQVGRRSGMTVAGVVPAGTTCCGGVPLTPAAAVAAAGVERAAPAPAAVGLGRRRRQYGMTAVATDGPPAPPAATARRLRPRPPSGSRTRRDTCWMNSIRTTKAALPCWPPRITKARTNPGIFTVTHSRQATMNRFSVPDGSWECPAQAGSLPDPGRSTAWCAGRTPATSRSPAPPTATATTTGPRRR